MPVSALNRAERAFVSVLLYVAAPYGVAVKVNRDTGDEDFLRACRQVVKKAHPDRDVTKTSSRNSKQQKRRREVSARSLPEPVAPFSSSGDLVLSTKADGGVRVRGKCVLLIKTNGAAASN